MYRFKKEKELVQPNHPIGIPSNPVRSKVSTLSTRSPEVGITSGTSCHGHRLRRRGETRVMSSPLDSTTSSAWERNTLRRLGYSS
ncbi:hypothetical protein MLD38_021696 [Melastoma candidum]|uniref:Uncharacterized protein n=1 Tax=Melastoma candidum TaxID=119954 RepID=A0ACB9QG41_9MYRT|nr:hypothetical protein MLD38_021696 [Melastoma candidum]